MSAAEPRFFGPVQDALRRPCGRVATLLLGLIVCVSPAWLFFDPLGPSRRAPLASYRVRNDDWLYLAASRTLARTNENLFTPHNTHIVPCWRVFTWMMSAGGGRLAAMPPVLGAASYAIILAVMFLTGRLVAIETARAAAGWAAAVVAWVRTTSLMYCPATFFSAGQTLWAALGILATLRWPFKGGGVMEEQARARAGGPRGDGGGGFWTIGHLAGPLGRGRYLPGPTAGCYARLAAIVPLGATLFAVTLNMALGAHKIDSTIGFHGRTTREAMDPWMGVSHTFQAITENLVLGNLGLYSETTPEQAAAITIGLIGISLWLHRRGRGYAPLELARRGGCSSEVT